MSEKRQVTTFKRGDQIAYVPDHACGNIYHPDAEQGFITSIRDDYAFCRYWSKHHIGLRTTANSEMTPVDRLVHTPHWRSQVAIDNLLEQIGEE